ncbi:hypothetical protein SeMB42_g06201 [Synchytrium endobioticum]|nr:hypothetical protein SeMB42_g06201 [Synchytrium endobioticum]
MQQYLPAPAAAKLQLDYSLLPPLRDLGLPRSRHLGQPSMDASNAPMSSSADTPYPDLTANPTMDYKQNEVHRIVSSPYYSNTAFMTSAFAPDSPHVDTAAALAQMKSVATAPAYALAQSVYRPHPVPAAAYLPQGAYSMDINATTSNSTSNFNGDMGLAGNPYSAVTFNQYHQQHQQILKHHQPRLPLPMPPMPNAANGNDDPNRPRQAAETRTKGKPDLEYVGALALLGMRKQSAVLPSPPVSNSQSPTASPPSSSPLRPSHTDIHAPMSPASPVFNQNGTMNNTEYHNYYNNAIANQDAHLCPPLQKHHHHSHGPTLENHNFASSLNMYGSFGPQMGQMSHVGTWPAPHDARSASGIHAYDAYSQQQQQQQWPGQNAALSQPHMTPHSGGGVEISHNTSNVFSAQGVATLPQLQQQHREQVDQLNPQPPQSAQHGQQINDEIAVKNEQSRNNQQKRVASKRAVSRNQAAAPQEIDISNIELDPNVDEPIFVGNVVGRRRGVAASYGGGHIFTCDYPGCGKVFRRLYNLKSHMCCHMGDRPFVCEKCHVTFKRIADLRRHIRCLHSSIRPFHCPTCSAGFARSDVFHHHVEFCRHPHNGAIPPVLVKRTGRGGSRVSLNGIVSPSIVASGVSGVGPNSVHKYNAYGVNPLQVAAQVNIGAQGQAAAHLDDNGTGNSNSSSSSSSSCCNDGSADDGMVADLQQTEQHSIQTPKQSTQSKQRKAQSTPSHVIGGRKTRKKRIDYSKYVLSEEDGEVEAQNLQDGDIHEAGDYTDKADNGNYED